MTMLASAETRDDTTNRIPTAIAAELVDPAAYADDRIYAAYRWLRANQPLGRAEAPGFDPFWVVTRYAEVKEISRQNALFLNAPRNSQLVNKASDDFVRAATGGEPTMARSLINVDGPEHMRLRLLTQNWFAPKSLKTIKESIGDIADAAVDAMLARGGQCDFVKDVALHYPLRIVMRILGVPPEDEPFMLRMTQEVFAPLDEDSVREGLDVSNAAHAGQQAQAAAAEIDRYFSALTEDRRRNPQNDIATLLANATLNGKPLSAADRLGYFGIIAVAGHDTTSSSSAGAMWALAEDPALLARVRADPTLVPSLVEEAIRYTTPVKTFMRTAAENTFVGNQAIGKGDWLMLCYASANRDEAVFPDADKFDIDRPQNKDQIAFGFGAHLCIGQHLARQEMNALFERLLPRLASVEFSGPPSRSKSCFVNGPKSMPIRFTVA